MRAIFKAIFKPQPLNRPPGAAPKDNFAGRKIMGSAKKKGSEMVAVSTDTLKDSLNKVYDSRRGHSKMQHLSGMPEGLFEYLWDLKEKALLERRNTVEVPSNWLQELEEQQTNRRNS